MGNIAMTHQNLLI
jgi:tetratricopeptide (TPR) repeat protein